MTTQTPAKTVTQNAPAVTTTPTVDVKPVETPLTAEHHGEKVPSNWEITPGEDDKIIAVNIVTNRRIEATPAEFSKIFKA